MTIRSLPDRRSFGADARLDRMAESEGLHVCIKPAAGGVVGDCHHRLRASYFGSSREWNLNLPDTLVRIGDACDEMPVSLTSSTGVRPRIAAGHPAIFINTVEACWERSPQQSIRQVCRHLSSAA